MRAAELRAESDTAAAREEAASTAVSTLEGAANNAEVRSSTRTKLGRIPRHLQCCAAPKRLSIGLGGAAALAPMLSVVQEVLCLPTLHNAHSKNRRASLTHAASLAVVFCHRRPDAGRPQHGAAPPARSTGGAAAGDGGAGAGEGARRRRHSRPQGCCAAPAASQAERCRRRHGPQVLRVGFSGVPPRLP